MSPAPTNKIFCNRTLNLRSIKAIGYDLDYTLVHYNTVEWERRAYHHTRRRLEERGWPVVPLSFQPDDAIQGLTIDLALGNLLKVTRFGYVIRAAHGTRLLEFDELRSTYSGTVVDLSEARFVFLNTLFSLSEATLFAQLVDLVDSGEIPEVVGYDDLYRIVSAAVDDAHMEGTLKSEILADPDRFVDPDPEVVGTLRDQHDAGKKLLLITNSDWGYVQQVMELAIDPFVPDGTWRDLFDTVIVSAGKPGFFEADHPLYRVVDERRGWIEPHLGPIEGREVFFGGCASRVEESLGLSGDEILYVGDHLFGDVHVSKALLRWRTALVIRELEPEIEALIDFAERERELTRLMAEKESSEERLADLRLQRLHLLRGGGDRAAISAVEASIEEVQAGMASLDMRITPLAVAAGELSNRRWGLLMRAGIDKSLFARQVERYADIYTSRVSNLRAATPFGFLRAFRSPLPHDLR